MTSQNGQPKQKSEKTFLTFEDILRIYPDIENNLEEVENLLEEVEPVNSGDLAKHYMDIGLSPEEFETRLEEKGLNWYLQKIGEFPRLSLDEEKKLAEKANQGDKEARDQLATANLRLVVSIARKFKKSGLPLVDLIQAGNIGLLKAIEKYDVNKETKLGTYAISWIKDAIVKTAVKQSRFIKLPKEQLEKLKIVKEMQRTLAQELQRRPRIEEIAQRAEIPLGEVTNILVFDKMVISLETPRSEEGGKLVDFVEEETSRAEVMATKHILRDYLIELLKNLSPIEQEVIKLRYGMEDDTPRSQGEVSKILNLSLDDVKKIETASLEKLRQLGEDDEYDE